MKRREQRPIGLDAAAVIEWFTEPEPNTGCWLWTGALTTRGYGSVRFDGRGWHAHRLSYQAHRGKLIPTMEVDHLCRTHCCVNPAHLEQVSHATNVARGDLGKTNTNRGRAMTHCHRGHVFDEQNTYMQPSGWRKCRRCAADYQIRRRARVKGLQQGV
jgi:hypothetical protein